MRRAAAFRLVRPWILLAGSTAIMVAASFATHLGAPGEAASEAAEHAEHAGLPTTVGPVGALLLLGILWLLRGRAFRPAWFLLMPFTAFAIQELAERLTEAPVPEPTAAATTLMQLLFGLLAFALARVVLRAARRFARFLACQPTQQRPSTVRRAWPVTGASIARLSAPAGAHFGRAPPIPT